MIGGAGVHGDRHALCHITGCNAGHLPLFLHIRAFPHGQWKLLRVVQLGQHSTAVNPAQAAGLLQKLQIPADRFEGYAEQLHQIGGFDGLLLLNFLQDSLMPLVGKHMPLPFPYAVKLYSCEHSTTYDPNTGVSPVRFSLQKGIGFSCMDRVQMIFRALQRLCYAGGSPRGIGFF
ncbi:hypothetical protein D3C76_1281010 [compost metagenome]